MLLENSWLPTSQAQICPVEAKISNSTAPNITKRRSHYPWDKAPHCTIGAENKVYCVFTNSKFARGRGVSVFTTPSVASSIAASILAFGDVESSSPSSLSLFYQKELPGRGKGYVSNHTFEKGELMLTSTPVLIFHESALKAIKANERRLLQREAVTNLPSETHDLFYDLAGHFGGDRTEDILLTNGFYAGLGSQAAGHGVVVPEAARLNHDCRPNARYAFDPHALVHKFHAARKILPGEELTFSYIDSRQVFAARQRQIKAHWGFECKCAHCSASESVRAESDARLERIPALREALLSFAAPSLRATTTDMALELVDIYEKERLDGSLAEAFMLAAFRFCTWEMEVEAKKWAAIAIKHWLVWEGGGAINLEKVKMLNENPQGQWCWGMRRNVMEESGKAQQPI